MSLLKAFNNVIKNSPAYSAWGPGVLLPNLLYPSPNTFPAPLTFPAATPWDRETLPSAGFITASWSSVAILPAIPAKQTPENYPLGPGVLRKFLEPKIRRNPEHSFLRSKSHYQLHPDEQ